MKITLRNCQMPTFTMRLRGKHIRGILLFSMLSSAFAIFYFGNYSLSYFLRLCGNECKDEVALPSKLFSEANSSKYLIHTPGCIIPEFDSTHPSIADYRITEFEELVCSTKLPLTEESGLYLIFHEERIPEYESSKNSINCSYQGIVRVEQSADNYDRNANRRWLLKEKILFKKRKTPIDEDGILVTCEDTKKTSVIYQNVHYFIQPRRALKKREQFKAEVGERGMRPEKLSVVIMGTDSVSRGNLRRHMPKTFHYLTNYLHAIDLQGYNKVGDNTDPNLMAALMGLTRDQLEKHECRINDKYPKYDNCPFIWKNFSEKGFVTVYGEDAPFFGVFQDSQVGYVKEPTDYFNRPYFQASEAIIGHIGDLSRKLGINSCQGGKKSNSVIHDYSLTVAEQLKDIPYFGFYWSASTTHQSLESALIVDQSSVDYLKAMLDGGYLEHTILFFISDHGMRYGSFRTTYAGVLEERLPYVTIMIPNWFKEQYPEAVQNMRINTRRLTSTFDIYVTLHDILSQGYANLKQRSNVSEFGQSLFQEISVKRKCQDAGISDHFCACEHTTEADPNDPQLQEAAKEAVAAINRGLVAFPNCAPLTLDKVHRGWVGSARKDTVPRQFNTVTTSYIIIFFTQPGGAMMEATVKNEGGNNDLTTDVSRINLYGNQSHCITNKEYKKYCYCKDLL